MVQVNQEGLKLNGTHQLLVYANVVNVLCGSKHTTKKNKEAIVDASKEIGLKVNADKTKYLVMSRDQKAGRIWNIKIDYRVEELKYLATNLTYQNSIQEEIKSRLKPGNACYNSMQSFFAIQLAIQKN